MKERSLKMYLHETINYHENTIASSDNLEEIRNAKADIKELQKFIKALSQQREEKTRIKEAWEKEIELKTKHVREELKKEFIKMNQENIDNLKEAGRLIFDAVNDLDAQRAIAELDLESKLEKE